MLRYLSKPYPSIIEDGYKKSLIINISVAFVVFFVLYVFKPSLFFAETVSYGLRDSLMFSAITFIVSIFYTNILTRLFPKIFIPRTWTFGKEILMLFSILFTIAIVNFFVGREVFYPSSEFDIKTFLQVIFATFIVGVIPMIVVVAFYLYYHQKKLSEKAKNINNALTTQVHSKTDKTYLVTGQGKNESLEISLDQLAFIESIGNYCDIYYLLNNQPEKTTFRASLASLRAIFPDDIIIKTHRSFLVNIDHIEKVSGNAQGYQLFLDSFPDKVIPVSRANINTFDSIYH
ncbi:MAG: LytTR family transcriptional regulator [Flavobacteriales bacterium]|nr:LytTR family transcriptional regulator [Flavobacteriales bacterium]MCB9197771.1 LytTR family transcriptional regulator [Flavobacteriales bacterium]